jgi:hypothetical protein
MQESLPEHELKNQYISVLLEFYGAKRELSTPSPMEKSKLRYWQKIVSMFERLRPVKTRNKARYRAGRAEAKKLSPIQVAMVRYAWAAFYDAEEADQDVQRRWEQYLYGDPPESNGNMTEYELFRQKRQFREIVAGIKREDLWPWA